MSAYAINKKTSDDYLSSFRHITHLVIFEKGNMFYHWGFFALKITWCLVKYEHFLHSEQRIVRRACVYALRLFAIVALDYKVSYQNN